MSYQRRRGQTVLVYLLTMITDQRGNDVLVPDLENPVTITAAAIPQRSQRAEVPGQQQIDVVRLIIPANIGDVGLWGRVLYQGDYWDIVAPPAYHHGTRKTRHTSVDIRRRPS